MAKTLNELSRGLKEFIIEAQSDAHNVGNIKKYRYNNLKLELSDPRLTLQPQVIITIGMSEAIFDLNTGEKISGGLGPDDRYVFRWLDRGSNREELRAAYQRMEQQVGKANGAE